MTTQTPMDGKKMEEFAGRFLGQINGASVVALAALGREAGLFEVMATLPASTSVEIAGAAGLNERYVREWLGGMTLGRVVEYEPETRKYLLPPEHAAFLTKEAGPNDIGGITKIFSYMTSLQDSVLASFRNGGGVPYSAYTDFQRIQSELTTPMLDVNLVSAILPLAPGVSERLAAGGEALDIGSGAGHASNILAAAYPAGRFAGYDFSDEGVAMAQAESTGQGLTNTRFEVRDIAALDEQERYDLVTAIEVVHDLAQPEKVLRGVYNSLKPDGVFLAVDIAASSNLEENMDHPMGPGLFMFSVFHCMTVSLSQGGAGLGTVVGEQKTTELLREAGFKSIEVNHLDGDFFYAYYVARKS